MNCHFISIMYVINLLHECNKIVHYCKNYSGSKSVVILFPPDLHIKQMICFASNLGLSYIPVSILKPCDLSLNYYHSLI